MREVTSKIQDKKLFLLDIDGTISFDATPIQGTMQFLNEVRKRNGKYVFITNNSTKSIKDYVEKFKGMGIEADETNFLTSSYVTGVYLQERYKGELLYIVGTTSFLKELQSLGLYVTDCITKENKKKIKAAVIGFDNELTYKKITDVCELLQTEEVDYLATNPDLVCPVSYGYVPDCGAICNMVREAVKREPTYIGKPNKIMVDMACELYGFTKEETIVVGDRLYTDIACGIEAKVDTALVFTGEAKYGDLATTPYPPTYYCDSILDLFKALVEKETL